MNIRRFLIVTSLLLLAAEPVFAYLDPGTGSMLLQVILGGVAAVAVAIKLFWYKIRAAVGLGKKSSAEDETG
jgi:hypothetical protein